MPRHIIKSANHPKLFARLVKDLAHELVSPSGDAQPLILEQHLRVTKSRHLHVIWDEWEGLPDDQRTEVITEAYAQAEGNAAAEEITLAIGVTPREALALGLLPYKVEPAGIKDEMNRWRGEALADEVKRTVLGPLVKELRYATREEAKNAVARLKKYPLAHRMSWVIVKEADRE